ncbi:hypothetical protein T4D_386 [Trichinella pseudospiralis]|uniref:Uncharacterized protein n=1 Tax=Trichinella pseudospiralis TaxID=6337 RepID=A0A0V1F5D1_TRIPS|nr:hypothetical protein T4D_386 [Trichinella pseudospiralis]
MQILPHSVGQEKRTISPYPWSGEKTLTPRTYEAGETTKSHPPLQRGKSVLSPLQGRGACAQPAQRAREEFALSLVQGKGASRSRMGPIFGLSSLLLL